MIDAERFKLRFGRYRTPRFTYGARVHCEVRGPMRIVGLSNGRIPWPLGIPIERPSRRSHVVYKGLAKAVHLEAETVVAHWWGVALCTVRKWRRALDVPASTKGTTKLRRLYGREEWFAEAQRKAVSVADAPERRAKIAAARRGKPRPKHVIAAMRRRMKGTRLSNQARRRMSETHKARGTRPPAAGRAWEPWEDELVRTLPTAAAVTKTGRTLSAVRNRRYALGVPDGRRRGQRQPESS